MLLRSLAPGCKVSACVQVRAGMSPWFDVQSGVKQGCAMSAWLFYLYLDSCFEGVKSSDMGVKVGDLNVNRLLYGDDAVFMHYQNVTCIAAKRWHYRRRMEER